MFLRLQKIAQADRGSAIIVVIGKFRSAYLFQIALGKSFYYFLII